MSSEVDLEALVRYNNLLGVCFYAPMTCSLPLAFQSVADAQLLASQIQWYYCDKTEGMAGSYRVPYTMNHRPAEFDFQEVIHRLETLNQTPPKAETPHDVPGADSSK